MIEPRAYLGVFWNPNSNNDYKYNEELYDTFINEVNIGIP